MTYNDPSHGEIWMLNLDPTRGHEQSGTRPALIISVDTLNHGPAGLVIALPITSKSKGIPFHVAVDPPEGGVTMRSYVKCEDIRSVSKDRLQKRLGRVRHATLATVENSLRILLGL